MAYERSQMLYHDYSWRAVAAHDNPYYTRGIDHSEINKTEGYEVLYFINHFGKICWPSEPNTAAYQKVERILINHVPPRSTHKKAEAFIVNNWKNY